MSVTLLNTANFADTIKNTEGKQLVDFYADWCGPCKMQGPIVDQLAEEMADVHFYKVNIDESIEIAREYGIMSIPTIMVIKDGTITYKEPGLCQKDELIDLLK